MYFPHQLGRIPTDLLGLGSVVSQDVFSVVCSLSATTFLLLLYALPLSPPLAAD